MEMIHALGINQFAIVQFCIFILVFSFLTFYVFTPFFRASEERQKRTVGGEELAEEYSKKSVELHSEYQDKARGVHSHIHGIFQKNRSEALAEYDRIVNRARQDASDLIEKNRQVIARSVERASEELRSQTPAVALAITNKLLGK